MYVHVCVRMCTCVLHTLRVKITCPKSRVLLRRFAASITCIHCARARELLLKIMAVLAKVGTLRERLPSVLVDPCLYYCCTAHQALAALCSLCTEGCARTVRSTCVGVRNVIREFIWTAATVLFTQVRTGFFLTCTVRTRIIETWENRSKVWQM